MQWCGLARVRSQRVELASEVVRGGIWLNASFWSCVSAMACFLRQGACADGVRVGGEVERVACASRGSIGVGWRA